MEDFAPIPAHGRTFSAQRRVRLSDMDSRGRVRLDTIARYLQDVAIDDVQETGWGIPEHLWFIRSIRIDILVPFLADREIELVTWCNGTAAIAAGRRWSVAGNAGGHAEVDSVWIHLTPDERPARIDGFDLYAEAANGRTVSSKLQLPDPPEDAERVSWQVRMTDIDRHGHVYEELVEVALGQRSSVGAGDAFLVDLRQAARTLGDFLLQPFERRAKRRLVQLLAEQSFFGASCPPVQRRQTAKDNRNLARQHVAVMIDAAPKPRVDNRVRHLRTPPTDVGAQRTSLAIGAGPMSPAGLGSLHF